MQVEIWSDISCPFCYIGKRNFEAGLEKFAHRDEVSVTWKSFQLDPTLPQEEMFSHEEYLSTKKGIEKEQVEKMLRHVTQMAKGVGLDYHFDKVITVNSYKAHRVIQMAKTKALGDKAEELFFKSYFTEGKNIADDAALFTIGKEIGLTQAEVQDALSNELYSQKADTDMYEAQQTGVGGVPFFVFDSKYAVSGAQPPQAFTQTLEKAFAEWQAKNPQSELEITTGQSCGVDGTCSAE
ncbi:MAG: DsbA family oxidoreductase [Chitinophagaceae bacterium]|nr:DsbA family oxidoreductase [Chitinophagaceae bacterium]